MEESFPITASELTHEWLSQTLLKANVITCPIVSYTTDIQLVEGNASNVIRLIPTYSDKEKASSQIQSFIIKFSSQNSGILKFLTDLQSYHKEIELYKEFSKDPKISLAKMYYSNITKDNSHCLIILEDLQTKGMSIANRKEGIAYLELKKILVHYAKVHSAFWDNIPKDLLWIKENDFPAYLQGLTMNVYHKRKDAFIKKYKEFLNEKLINTINKANIEELYKTITREENITITHGDPHGNNVLSNDKEVVIIDWQYGSIGVGVKDAVLFLGISPQDSITKENIEEIKQAYYDTLIQGMKNSGTYNRKSFDEDWRNCSLVSFCNMISVSPEEHIGDDTKIKDRYSDYLSTSQRRFINFLQLQDIYL